MHSHTINITLLNAITVKIYKETIHCLTLHIVFIADIVLFFHHNVGILRTELEKIRGDWKYVGNEAS